MSPEVGSLLRLSVRVLETLNVKADLIEPLGDDQVFEVVTPVGTFRFTKRDFLRDFSGLRETKSYRVGRIYHYPTLPAKALRYRVDE